MLGKETAYSSIIDWENLKVASPVGKPNFSLIKNKARVTNFGKNPDIHLSPIAVKPTPKLGKGGMVYEVAMSFENSTKRKIKVRRSCWFYSRVRGRV